MVLLFVKQSCSEICQVKVCIPDNYAKDLPPQQNTKEPMYVDFQFRLESVFNINNLLNTVSMTITLNEEWTDNRLRTKNEKWIKFPSKLEDMIWMPDIDMLRMNKMKVKKAFGSQTLLWLEEEDNQTIIGFEGTFDLSVNCPMTYRAFPFDQNLCYIHIGETYLKCKY